MFRRCSVPKPFSISFFLFFLSWLCWWKLLAVSVVSGNRSWKTRSQFEAGLCVKKMVLFKAGMFFLWRCQTCLSVNCKTLSFCSKFYDKLSSSNVNANILCLCVWFFYRILFDNWDVRALEAGLTEGAWWNTNPSRSMSASCVCHVSLGSMVAAGNAINVPTMTPLRWGGVETSFVYELYQ